MSDQRPTGFGDICHHGSLARSCETCEHIAEVAAKDAEIALLTTENNRLTQALNAAVAGEPIGPVVGACTIVEQEHDIRRLTAEIARLNNKLNADSQNFQIGCQKAEIARLRDQRDKAQISVAMKQGEIVDLSDQNAALRERCGRLANEVMAWRMADADSSSPDFYTHKAHRREITERMATVNAHNDLTPAAVEAQERTDG